MSKGKDPNSMLHYVASDMGLHCLPMPMEIPYQLHKILRINPFSSLNNKKTI